jgi:capsular polysaccharide transport system permease protein
MKTLVNLSGRTLALLLLALPLLLYGAYLGLLAADRYVSESVISVRQSGGDGGTGGIPGAALMLAGLNPPAHEDTLYLKQFVHSRGLLAKLDEKLDLRAHFANAGADWPFRLSPDASQEDFFDYYRARVEVGFDERAALLKIRTQGFEPAFAQKVNQAILEESERFVNETSQRFALERLRFAEGELQLAAERLQAAKNKLLAFQNRHRLLDPAQQAQATGALTAELEATRSRLEAELGSLLGYLNEGSYQVRALRQRIAALNRQIDAERRRATTNPRQGERLNQLAVEFQALQLQAQFAQDAYRLALGAVENARIDATRKIKSLLVVEPPSLPQTAEYPRQLYNLGTLLAVCVLLFAIVRLVLATIREHQD